jgi:ribose transport system substrate-binding protein
MPPFRSRRHRSHRQVAATGSLAGALLLAGCAGDGTAGTTATRCNPRDTSKRFVIGIAQWDLKEPYRAQAKADYERLVKRYPRFTLEEMDAQGSVDKQITDVEVLLTKQVDLIVLYPGDSAGLQNVVKDVHDAGVPLLEVDRSTPDASQYTAMLGGDNRAIAQQEASYLAQNLPQGTKVVIITGDLASDAATERAAGAREGLKTRPDLTVLPEQTAKWRAELAQSVVEAILNAHPDLAGIVYANDEESVGGTKALVAAGKDGQVKQVSIDGLKGPDGGRQEVKDGKLLATFVYPNGAVEVLKAADTILTACGTVEKRQIIDTQRIDASNINTGNIDASIRSTS